MAVQLMQTFTWSFQVAETADSSILASIAGPFLVIILLLIAGGAGLYLYKAKRKGEHCIGCPYAKQCGSKSCNCSSKEFHSPKQ